MTTLCVRKASPCSELVLTGRPQIGTDSPRFASLLTSNSGTAVMIQIPCCVDSPIRARDLTWRSTAVLFLGLAVTASALLALPRIAVHAADDANASTGARPSVDIIDRLSRKHAAAQRVEELDQESWKAISKEGDFAHAVMSMSHAAELARSEFGGDHWLAVVKESLATGLKSLEDLPPARRQLLCRDTQSPGVCRISMVAREQGPGAVTVAPGPGQAFRSLWEPTTLLSANFLLGLAFTTKM